ncbi:MAG: DinB family protein [Bacteroidetes bacterium]|nr:DinB family protein [Bacteroidota bacterium]
MSIKILHPGKEEYPERFQDEINLVFYPELISGLEESHQSTIHFLNSIPEEKLLFSYAEGKWTVKEVWQHVMDTERILSYRALCYSRKETKPLPGFDENAYAMNSKANARNWNELLGEYSQIRLATLSLYKSFDEEMLSQIGFAGVSTKISTKAVGFLILGHEIHHAKTIKERYL